MIGQCRHVVRVSLGKVQHSHRWRQQHEQCSQRQLRPLQGVHDKSCKRKSRSSSRLQEQIEMSFLAKVQVGAAISMAAREAITDRASNSKAKTATTTNTTKTIATTRIHQQDDWQLHTQIRTNNRAMWKHNMPYNNSSSKMVSTCLQLADVRGVSRDTIRSIAWEEAPHSPQPYMQRQSSCWGVLAVAIARLGNLFDKHTSSRTQHTHDLASTTQPQQPYGETTNH